MRVLVVEDHAALALEIARGLRRDGFAVDLVDNGYDAIDKAATHEYDVIVLDRDLPGIHGDDVCREIAAWPAPPCVLMLTAADSIDSIVNGLNLGADDYLVKPFALVELSARIRAAARRSGSAPRPVVRVADLEIRPDEHRVERAGQRINLSPKEFGVLEVLASQPGTVVSAETLLEKVWDEYADPLTSAVRVAMVTLRRKLGEPALISTVKGVGYVLRDPETS